MKNKLISLSLFLSLSFLAINAQVKDTMNLKHFQYLANKQIGTQIKDWSLKDLKGNIHKSEDLKGKIILVNFWAIRCGACIMIDKDLKDLQSRFDSIGFKIVDIECDNRNDSSKINRFTLKKKICENTLIDGYNTRLKYGVVAFPTLFLIDRSGKIVYNHLGYFYNDKKNEMIEQIKKIK